MLISDVLYDINILVLQHVDFKKKEVHMSNSFHPILDTYSRGTINAINFDMDFDKISVAISNKSIDDHIEQAEIVFEDVKAFYYIDHDLPSDMQIKGENLNSISYDLYGFGEFSAAHAKSEDEAFVSIPNFAVSINDSSLFIDANKIVINNQAFKVR